MEFRFRYLGPKGEEIEVASLEGLRVLVQDGSVGELTLLFDALTREWAPARSHAVYRFLRDETRPRPAGPVPPPPPPSITEKRRTRSRAPESGSSEGGDPTEDDLGSGLTFSMTEPAVAAEEAAREILRARDREEDRPVGSEGFSPWASAPRVEAEPIEVGPIEVKPVEFARAAAKAATVAPKAAAPKPAAGRAAPARSAQPLTAPTPIAPAVVAQAAVPAVVAQTAAPASPPAPLAVPAPAAASAAPAADEPLPLLFEPPAEPAQRGPWPVSRPLVHSAGPTLFFVPQVSLVDRIHTWLDRFGTLVLWTIGPRALPRLLIAGGLIGLLFVLLGTLRRANVGAAPLTMTTTASLGPDVGRLVASLGSAQESGFQNMVSGVDSLRRTYEIQVVPQIWLEGKYLADAPRYPEVMDFWLRYQAFLADVRAHDTLLYRAGFVHNLEEQGIGGTVLTLRLSQAMRDFDKTQPQREQVYQHMDELSSASLQLHALLVDRAGDITYEPAIQHGVSREPVVEAVAEDTLLRDHMWTLLERIFASLDWVGGGLHGSRDNLTDRLLEGIKATTH